MTTFSYNTDGDFGSRFSTPDWSSFPTCTKKMDDERRCDEPRPKSLQRSTSHDDAIFLNAARYSISVDDARRLQRFFVTISASHRRSPSSSSTPSSSPSPYDSAPTHNPQSTTPEISTSTGPTRAAEVPPNQPLVKDPLLGNGLNRLKLVKMSSSLPSLSTSSYLLPMGLLPRWLSIPAIIISSLLGFPPPDPFLSILSTFSNLFKTFSSQIILRRKRLLQESFSSIINRLLLRRKAIINLPNPRSLGRKWIEWRTRMLETWWWLLPSIQRHNTNNNNWLTFLMETITKHMVLMRRWILIQVTIFSLAQALMGLMVNNSNDGDKFGLVSMSMGKVLEDFIGGGRMGIGMLDGHGW